MGKRPRVVIATVVILIMIVVLILIVVPKDIWHWLSMPVPK